MPNHSASGRVNRRAKALLEKPADRFPFLRRNGLDELLAASREQEHTLSTEDPGFPEWPDGEEDDPHVSGNAWLSVDQETRVCQVAIQGPAAAILRLLDPADEHGMLEMLSVEAAFDEIVLGLSDSREDPDVE